jgi:uncharacterized spore protein YtfJ
MTADPMSREAAEQAAQRPTDAVLATLAEQVGARFSASTVFGAPVERDGVTVIPVATIRFGIGGGAGSDPGKGQEGQGGGGAGQGSAAGYIEIKDGRTRFVPVVQPARMVLLFGTMLLAGLAILRTARAESPASRLPWR